MNPSKVKITEMDSVVGSGSLADRRIGSSPWATIVLLMLVVFMLSRVVGLMDSPALAEMAVSENGYTMMTTNGGTDEILVLVDSREESILVYRVAAGGQVGAQGGGSMELLERESLSGVFTRARAQAIGGP